MGRTSVVHIQTGRCCAHVHLGWTRTISSDSNAMGKVCLRVPLSHTVPGPGAAAPPARQYKEED